MCIEAECFPWLPWQFLISMCNCREVFVIRFMFIVDFIYFLGLVANSGSIAPSFVCISAMLRPVMFSIRVIGLTAVCSVHTWSACMTFIIVSWTLAWFVFVPHLLHRWLFTRAVPLTSAHPLSICCSFWFPAERALCFHPSSSCMSVILYPLGLPSESLQKSSCGVLVIINTSNRFLSSMSLKSHLRSLLW